MTKKSFFSVCIACLVPMAVLNSECGVVKDSDVNGAKNADTPTASLGKVPDPARPVIRPLNETFRDEIKAFFESSDGIVQLIPGNHAKDKKNGLLSQIFGPDSPFVQLGALVASDNGLNVPADDALYVVGGGHRPDHFVGPDTLNPKGNNQVLYDILANNYGIGDNNGDKGLGDFAGTGFDGNYGQRND